MEQQTENITKEKIKIELPGRYNVIIHNDDITPMGFVVEILHNIFNMEREKAFTVMMEIHEKGKGIAGTYIKSIAEAKAALVRDVAMKAEYPLNVTIEKN